MIVSDEGLRFIAEFESLHDGDLTKIGIQPKTDCSGIWTVGYGHALFIHGKPVFDFALVEKFFPEFLNIDDAKAWELLKEDTNKAGDIVKASVRAYYTQRQFDMLTSHTMNTGGSSTLFQLINDGAKMEDIGNWWKNHYITSLEKKLPGLVRRRSEEFTIYSKS